MTPRSRYGAVETCSNSPYTSDPVAAPKRLRDPDHDCKRGQMHIDLNDEQRALRDELRAYFTDLMNPELEQEVTAGEGGGPLFRKAMKKLGVQSALPG